MANIKSQIKRNKQAEAARERNKAVKSALKTSIKRFNEASLVSVDEAKARLGEAVVSLDKAASDKVIHANEAARKKSVMMKKFNAVAANPPAPVIEEEKPKKKKAPAKKAVTAKTTAAKATAKKAPAKKIAAKKPAKKKAPVKKTK